MASITTTAGGARRIQFFDGAKERKSIPLGRVTMERALEVKTKVEALNRDAIAGHAWQPATTRWVAKQGPDLYDKLAKVGLVPRREAVGPKTIAAWLDAYIKSRVDVKPGTAIAYAQTRRCLVGYFGADRPLAMITPADADAFRVWLGDANKGEGLGPNTVRRRCSMARQFFRGAVRARIIVENPFADMKAMGVKPNRSRDRFITRAEADKVLAKCPDAQWRLVFALSRFGGLRCPSEHLALRWGDVNWELGRLTVRSPKTEHHEGKESRVVPLFPELRVHLQALWDEVTGADGFDPKAQRLSEQPIITRYRDSKTNLRTQFARIVKAAGLKPWPKLFHNLRASRETELTETYPLHVVCEWIGNSQAVAAKHYLQVTDQHFEAAASGAPTAPTAVHTPAPGEVNGGNESQGEEGVDAANAEETAESPGLASAASGGESWLARIRT